MDKIIIFVGLLLVFTASATAQVASGGNYTLNQSVIASGGGTSNDTTNNIYKTESTIGEAVAGTTSSNSPFTVRGGFLTAESLSPTAAAVSVTGKVSTPEGRGLRNALVVLTDMQGNRRIVMSSAAGYFRFVEIEAGQTYIFTVVSKRYQFSPQVLPVLESLENLNFTAQP